MPSRDVSLIVESREKNLKVGMKQVLLTNIRHNTTDDNLTPIGGLDGSLELGIIPSADLALSLDQRRIGVQFQNLFWQWAVRTLLAAGGQDDGDIEDLAEGRMCHHVAAVQGGVKIAGELVEADLQVQDQEDGFVDFEALPGNAVGVGEG